MFHENTIRGPSRIQDPIDPKIVQLFCDSGHWNIAKYYIKIASTINRAVSIRVRPDQSLDLTSPIQLLGDYCTQAEQSNYSM
jgi:hypothetical protein